MVIERKPNYYTCLDPIIITDTTNFVGFASRPGTDLDHCRLTCRASDYESNAI